MTNLKYLNIMYLDLRFSNQFASSFDKGKANRICRLFTDATTPNFVTRTRCRAFILMAYVFAEHTRLAISGIPLLIWAEPVHMPVSMNLHMQKPHASMTRRFTLAVSVQLLPLTHDAAFTVWNVWAKRVPCRFLRMASSPFCP